MGSLTPGAKYIYEQVDGVTYSREAGAPPNTRVEIGRTLDSQYIDKQIAEKSLWREIHLAATSNPALQEAMERVKIIYYLSNDAKNAND